MLVVQKFGGTSLMDADRVRVAAARAVAAARQGYQVVAVVSAQGHITDHLEEKVLEITTRPDAREKDACLTAGEQISAALMAMAIQALGKEAVSLTGTQAGILTDGAHGNARVKGLCNDRICKELEQGKIVVVTGFQGVDPEGNITTLGRGGSDTTAVALAAFLKADLCQIYTDVDGVYDKDPRKDPKAVKYPYICYSHMLTLARSGAQVLHDRCVELAWEHGVKIQVLSSFRPGPGTVVGE